MVFDPVYLRGQYCKLFIGCSCIVPAKVSVVTRTLMWPRFLAFIQFVFEILYSFNFKVFYDKLVYTYIRM